ncbi:MAG: glycosyltransferase family 4 protein [Euryarchaeota archaeon]|nr:glycosyltransferase family 4 protein [Euryarchaeota archaeon]
MKKKILIFSDCYFFAGCENIIVNIFSDAEILKNFDIVFGYRYSSIYEKGLHSRLNTTDINLKKIFLPDITTINSIFEDKLKNTMITKGLKALFYVFYKCKIFFIIDFFVLLFVLLEVKPDVLHVNNGGYPGAESCLAIILASYLMDIENIYLHVNNIAAPYESRLLTIWDVFIDRLVFNRVTEFITASRTAGEKIIERRHAPQCKWMQIYNTILPRKVTLSKNEFLKKNNISNSKIIFSVISNFEERKGHIYLINAVEKIIKNDDFKNKFIVILEGSGNRINKIKEIIKNEHLEEYIKIIGREDNIMNLMNAMDVLIVPSVDYEDFPNVIVEAMYFSKPVIASRIAGIVEQIETNKTGILIEPKNIEHIKESMIYYINNSNKISEHGDNGKIKFNNQFRYEVIMQQIYALYTRFETV